jgi:hypothetical protein
MSIKFNFDKINGMEAKLRSLSRAAVPIANQRALNEAAFRLSQKSRQKANEKMIMRNKFSLGSIRFEKATGLDIRQQRSVVGSLQPYMATQEFGGVENAKGKHGVDIPTTTASGEAQTAKPRMRAVRRPKSMRAIQIKKFKTLGRMTKEREMVIKAQQAKRSGKKFIFLETDRKKGIFEVKGRIGKGGRISGLRLPMVHDLTQKSVKIPKNPWLKPSVDRIEKKMPRIYEKQLLQQLKRLGGR